MKAVNLLPPDYSGSQRRHGRQSLRPPPCGGRRHRRRRRGRGCARLRLELCVFHRFVQPEAACRAPGAAGARSTRPRSRLRTASGAAHRDHHGRRVPRLLGRLHVAARPRAARGCLADRPRHGERTGRRSGCRSGRRVDVDLDVLELDSRAGARSVVAPTGFTVTGYTYSQKSVARLMRRLQLLPWLTGIQLQSSQLTTVGTNSAFQFTITGGVNSLPAKEAS